MFLFAKTYNKFTKEIQPILDYVEGRLSADEFQKLFKTDRQLQLTLRTRLNSRWGFLDRFNYNLYDFLTNEYDFCRRSWAGIRMSSELQGVLEAFLENYKIPYVKFPKYDEEYDFLLDIQPSWVDVLDDKILEEVIKSIPPNLSKTKRIELGKAKIKELFRYDKTYPRWIQGAEWPIVNGKPLVFSHRERVKGDDYHYLYHFYDPDTKEETIVEQFS